MDTNINPVSGAGSQYASPALKIVTSFPAPAAQTEIAVQPAIASTNQSSSASDASQYEAAVRRAALSFKNVYALGDQQFSIFKDATGKYITRYVSLRDGKVTYVPEPIVVKQLQSTGTSNPPIRIAISA